MLVRCPECHTRFLLRPAQLQAADGKVRCGQCRHAFDARAQLPAAAPPAPSSFDGAFPAGEPIARGPSVLSTFVWSLGVVALLVLLVAQAIWWDREQLATDPDGLRAVQWLCRYAPCNATPPKAPEQIEVLKRSLAPSADGKSLEFGLLIVSKAKMPQPLPTVELRLFDAREKLVAAGRFPPADYRPGGAAGSLLPPNEPLQIQLRLAQPAAHAVGFQIDFQ